MKNEQDLGAALLRVDASASVTTEPLPNSAIVELQNWLKLMDHDPEDSTPLEDAVVEAIEALRACARAERNEGPDKFQRLPGPVEHVSAEQIVADADFCPACGTALGEGE